MAPLRAAGRAAGLALGLAGGLALLAGCNSLEARIHNLQQLHQEDGKVSYRADLVSETGYALRDVFRVSGPFGLDIDLSGDLTLVLGPTGDDEELVRDPSEESFEILRSLDEFPLGSPRTRLLRTEMYVWLLTGDPFVLSRELCARELGPIAGDLGLERPRRRPEDVPAPTAEELRPLVVALVDACAPVLRTGGTPEHRAALEAACDALDVLEYDVPSGRRALRLCAALVGASGAGRPSFEPVRELADSIASRLVADALTRALEDPAPEVRLAAMEAWIVATDNRVGNLLREQMRRDSSLQVLAGLCRLIAKHGMPESEAPLTPTEAEQWEVLWISNLVQVAVEIPDGEVSAAACKALSSVTDAGIESLRFEVWSGWWQEQLRARNVGPAIGVPAP